MTALKGALLQGLCCTALFAGTASAQEAASEAPASSGDYVEIGNNIGGYEGARQINISAGDSNQQANMATIASGEFAASTATLTQFTDAAEPDGSRVYSAKISDGAFSGSHGITSVNVVAGSGNQQANMAIIATGLEGRVATNAALSQTRASSQPHGPSGHSDASDYTAQIDSTAFADSSGIVQVSLIGGTGNTSANVAVLSMEGSASSAN